MFSSKSFIVSCHTFSSLIHFELIFVYVVRKCSSFILLQVVDQFSQHHVLKRLSSLLYSFASFVKDKVSIGVRIYLWAFYFIPLISVSIFVPVPYCLDDCSAVVWSEVRQVDASRFVLLSQDCVSIQSSLCLYTNCENICSSSVKITIGSLTGIEQNL